MDAFVIKNKPATLRCKAAHALQIYYLCNGIRADESLQTEFVDPHNGIRIVECELNITRDQIEEYFGKNKFKCECIAWTGAGQIKSQPAVVDVACKYLKIFLIINKNSPLGSEIRKNWKISGAENKLFNLF